MIHGVLPARGNLASQISDEATQALLEQPSREVRSWSYFDALMAAMRGWQMVSMLDLTEHAAEPFAWFVFRHEIEPWWCSFQAFTTCLSHPFEGPNPQVGLMQRGRLTAGLSQDEFVDELFALTSIGRPEVPASVFVRPDTGAGLGVERGARQTLDEVHARWAIGLFPKNERAQALLLLMSLGL